MTLEAAGYDLPKEINVKSIQEAYNTALMMDQAAAHDPLL